jgi:hypothetical protein
MSLTAPRLTPARSGSVLSLAVAASALCYAGGLAMRDASGNVKPGAAATRCRGIGRFKDTVDNSSGLAGDLSAEVEVGIFQFANSASADEITAADIGNTCYIVDDQTVARTSNSGARSVAGTVVDVDDGGVWIDFGAAQALNTRIVRFSALSTKASDAAISRALAGVAGRITRFWSISNAALATGDATLQLKINGTNVTTGLITITQSGSAAGDVDSVVPTAANVVGPDDVISVTGGGASTATATAECFVEITY